MVMAAEAPPRALSPLQLHDDRWIEDSLTLAVLTVGVSVQALRWVFSVSGGVSRGVINLSDEFNDRVAYVAGHTLVVLDRRDGQQTHLLGHRSAISATAAAKDRSLLATADVAGEDSHIVLWNPKTSRVVKTIERPHRHGTRAMEFSPDGQYLASIGVEDPETREQEISLWDLHLDPVRRAVSSRIPKGDPQHTLAFNAGDPEEIISNGRQRVYFWRCRLPGPKAFTYYSPPLNARDFKQAIGDFSVSCFVPGTSQAVSGTVDGDVVVWEEQGLGVDPGTSATDRTAVKVMKILKTAVSFLGEEGDYVVAGACGQVQFYDPLMRLVAWYDGFGSGAVTSVSFADGPPQGRLEVEDLQGDMGRFSAPDFAVGTSDGRATAVKSMSFCATWNGGDGCELLAGGMQTGLSALAAHPLRPEFLAAGSGGLLQKWDMIRHQMLMEASPLEGPDALCVTYFRDGSTLAVGYASGVVALVGGSDLGLAHSFHNTRAAVQRVAASSTGRHLAASTKAHQVLLYGYTHTRRGTLKWNFQGKCNAHDGPVVGLQFGESPAGETRLFSLGADGRLVEYDVQGCTAEGGVRVASAVQPCPGRTPTAMTFGPPLAYYDQGSADTELILAGEGAKLKVYNPDKGTNCATHLAPDAGGPISSLMVFRTQTTGHGSNYIAYATRGDVVGLMAWPPAIDGGTAMGVIAQPATVAAIALSFDGRKLVTAGRDGMVNVWDIDARALHAGPGLNPDRVARWTALIGEEALADVEDHFYYAQIRSQGEDATQERRITGKVPAGMVPNLMRGLGCFVSEADIQDIMSELAAVAAVGKRGAGESVDIDQFLSIYVRHREEEALTLDRLGGALEALGCDMGEGVMCRDRLVGLLTGSGEALSEEDLADVFVALTGYDTMEEALPEGVDGRAFAQLLGMEEASFE